MKLNEWRTKRQATTAVALPSGLEVQLRQVALLDLVTRGSIPETLDALTKRATGSGFGVADVKEFMPLINIVVQACLVDPPLADEPDDTHITLDELDTLDRMAIFNWANGVANAITPFREEQAGVVEPASGGDGVSQPA
jgi:hypothetical protein